MRFNHYVALLIVAGVSHGACAAELEMIPAKAELRGQAARQRLLVMSNMPRRADVTRQASFKSETPAIVQVSADGVVTPVGNGQGVVAATVNGRSVRSTFTVRDGTRLLPVSFELDVQPVLTRAGCNMGACHGKARGQNGFPLSLLGFDADFDYDAIVREARGRRVFPVAPAHSLFLTKPTGQMPHGGGKRLDPKDVNYQLLLRWITDGVPRRIDGSPTLTRIAIEPGERTLVFHEEQQLIVTAHYSDGSTRDVTHQTSFQSNEKPIAAVSGDGLVKAGPLPGETAIMARFMNNFAVVNITIPLPGDVPADVYAKLPRYNFIDGHVWDKLQRLGITASEPAGDATFLRRAYLDVIGRLPTPDEMRAFLADPAKDKRARLIDTLLDRPEYADFWANKWADLLRPNPYRVGVKAVYNFDAWLRESFRRNQPYDQFVRELLSAKGSTFRKGPVTLFRDRREPEELTTIVSQLFLGVRLECAKCHHHPFEVWGQDEFYSMAAYFSRIGRKGQGVSPPISGGEEWVFAGETGQVKHPGSGKVMSARPLFGKAASIDERDPRDVLADWIASDDNPYFAKVIVNRVWAELMGRGIVDPVDDLRATNPPSNGPLLDALAQEFRKQRYDQKKLLKTIMSSYVYGLASKPSPRNVSDTRNFSRHYRQRLRAETLLDAISDITEVPESFAAGAPGTRAVSLWTVRTESVFLDSFGRPDPNQDPPCERTPDTSVVQALHVMNSPNVHRKITADTGLAAKLAVSKKTPKEIITEVYARVYSRPPADDELAACTKLLEKPGTNRRQVTEDLLWALLNTPEFWFKD
jgi:hypothetical protein